MRRYVVLALVVGLLVGADKPKKDKGKKEATELEGTWVVVSATVNEKDDDQAKDAKVVFKGKNLTIKTKEGDLEGTFKIDFKLGKVQGKVYNKKGDLEFTFKIDPKKKTFD